MKVWTGRIGYKGRDGLDVTVKSSEEGRAFAPTWEMVMAHKRGQMSDAEYRNLYWAMMRRSWNQNRAAWGELLSRDEVTLLCYCRAGKFCHRRILAEILQKMGADNMGERA